jgi:hypothetical protein
MLAGRKVHRAVRGYAKARITHTPWCWAVGKGRPRDVLVVHDGDCTSEPPAAIQAPSDALKALAAKVVIDAVATKGDTDTADLDGAEGFESVRPEPVDLPHEHGARS